MVPPLKAPLNTFLPIFVHSRFQSLSQPASQHTPAPVHRPASNHHSRFYPESCMVPTLKAPLNTFLPESVHGRFMVHRPPSTLTVFLTSVKVTLGLGAFNRLTCPWSSLPSQGPGALNRLTYPWSILWFSGDMPPEPMKGLSSMNDRRTRGKFGCFCPRYPFP